MHSVLAERTSYIAHSISISSISSIVLILQSLSTRHADTAAVQKRDEAEGEGRRRGVQQRETEAVAPPLAFCTLC